MQRDDVTAGLEAELPHLRRYAVCLTRNPDMADDLVQECVLKAIEKREQFQFGTHLRRWLFTILRNLVIDRHREGQRRGPHLPISDMDREIRQPASQEDHIALREVEARLAALKPSDRQIIYLSVLSGLDHAEIAQHMNVAVGTVKSRLSRTRAKLAA